MKSLCADRITRMQGQKDVSYTQILPELEQRRESPCADCRVHCVVTYLVIGCENIWLTDTSCTFCMHLINEQF